MKFIRQCAPVLMSGWIIVSVVGSAATVARHLLMTSREHPKRHYLSGSSRNGTPMSRGAGCEPSPRSGPPAAAHDTGGNR